MTTPVDKSKSPRVGVQVLVVKDEKVLIGKDNRKGREVYGVPGGHWESGETLGEAANREVLEETGVRIRGVEFLNLYEFYREDKGVSYVTIGYTAKYDSGKPRDNVEEGRVGWQWLFPREALQMNLYPAGRYLLEAYVDKRR